jgi:hypothetical protein
MVLFALVVLGMMRLYPRGLLGMAPAAVATGPSAWRVLRPRTRTLHRLNQHTAGRALIDSGTRPILPYRPSYRSELRLVKDHVSCRPQEQPSKQEERKPHGGYLLSRVVHSHVTQSFYRRYAEGMRIS